MAEEKTRTEWRICGEREDGMKWQGSPQTTEPGYEVTEYEKRNKVVYVQRRTVTETPWKDHS